jgi:hypothetical protein
MILIVVVVAAVASFAYLLSSFQSQSQKQNDQVQNVSNENLKVTNVQLYPPEYIAPILSMSTSVRNDNTQTSAITSIELNGIFMNTFYTDVENGVVVANYTNSGNESVMTAHSSTTFEIDNLSLSRANPIMINVITASQNIFSFSLQPPVAEFTFNQQLGDVLNASGSYSPDSSIQSYNWNVQGYNQNGVGLFGPYATLSGQEVQYSTLAPELDVGLTVVDSYGLISTAGQTVTPGAITTSTGTSTITLTLSSTSTTTISDPTTTTTITGSSTSTTTETSTSTTTITTTSCSGSSCGSTSTCSNPTQDMALFVCPYLNQIEKVREVMMTPWTPGQSNTYGYYQPFGIVAGGGIEPAPALGLNNGWNNVAVVSDNNLEGGLSLDYWNNAASLLSNLPAFMNFNSHNYATSSIFVPLTMSLNTNIMGEVRGYYSGTRWYGVGACTGPTFQEYQYPLSFSLLDRREAEYGFIDPYATTLIQSGIQIGGIGSNCGTEGQTWYLPGYGNVGNPNVCSNSTPCCPNPSPCIVTEFPSNNPVVTNGGDDTQGFLVMEYYMQCVASNFNPSVCSNWQNAFKVEMSRYPWADTRGSAHFIEAARATGAWQMASMTYNGISAYTMLLNAISNLWSHGQDPANGGMWQNWGNNNGGRTPEPNMQTLTAFNPNLPTWFTEVACHNAGIASCR